MRLGEDAHISFSQLKEILGVLLTLEGRQADRAVCFIMLKGLAVLVNKEVRVRRSSSIYHETRRWLRGMFATSM